MAVEILSRRINTGTDIVGTKITVNVGFTAKAIFAFLTGRVGAVDSIAREDGHKGVGMAVSPTSRVCSGAIDRDSVGTTVCKSSLRDDTLVNVVNGSGSNGRLDLDAIGATSFDLIVDEVFAADYRVLLWVVGGSTPAASIVQYTSPLVTGNQGVTGFGLAPDIYFLLGINDDGSLPQFKGGSKVSFSAGVSSSEEAVSYSTAEDGKATSKTRHYVNDLEDYASAKANGAVEEIADHVSMDADGFTQDWTKVRNKNLEIFALAIEGGDWAILPILTVADIVTPIPIGGLASSPGGGLIISAGEVENASDTELAPSRISYGAWDSLESRGAHGELSGDALGTTDVSAAVENDACLVRIGSSATLQGIMDLQSRDAFGATFIMDQADSAPHFAWGVFGGPFVAPAAPAAPTLLAVTCVSFAQIDLAWVDNAIDEDVYRVERETPVAGGFVVIAEIPADSTAFSDTTVLPGTQYNYRVRAVKFIGPTFSAYSNEDECTTPMPPSGGGMTTVEGPTGPLTRVVG